MLVYSFDYRNGRLGEIGRGTMRTITFGPFSSTYDIVYTRVLSSPK